MTVLLTFYALTLPLSSLPCPGMTDIGAVSSHSYRSVWVERWATVDARTEWSSRV